MEGLIPLAFSALKRHKTRRFYHSLHGKVGESEDGGFLQSQGYEDTISRSASSSPVVFVGIKAEESLRQRRSKSLVVRDFGREGNNRACEMICSSAAANNNFQPKAARKSESNARDLVLY